MKNSSNQQASIIFCVTNDVGQRIDNYLVKILKGVPKSRIYRMIRSGELRINSGRVKAGYRLQPNDKIRVPPVRTSAESAGKPTVPENLQKTLLNSILYEDNQCLILNKPSGLAVHGGSGVNYGVIEILRTVGNSYEDIELAHRLDKETSGCLVLAKKRSILKEIHDLLRSRQVKKSYLALIKGKWQGGSRVVNTLLEKNTLHSGERITQIANQGKTAISEFIPVKFFSCATLMQVNIVTGRTHQIRVHAAYLGRPVAGDCKYGDKEFNKLMRNHGLKRLFLHAHKIEFKLSNGKQINVCADLSDDLKEFLEHIEC